MSARECNYRFRPISDLTEQRIDWLWPCRLALGKPALLEGDPGLGKSLIALDLCARLSRGLPFPDGSPSPGPCNCLVLNAEDDPGGTVRSRLLGLGADLTRIFVMQARNPDEDVLRLPSQIKRLEDVVRRTQARLVVIDPLLAFLDDDVNPNNDQGVRRALRQLGRLAARCSCVPLLHRHLNKTAGKQAIYRGGGSIGMVGLCRSAWLVGRDPLDPGRCVLAQVKNNLAPPQPSLAYRVQAEPSGAATLSWLGTSLFSADQIVGGLSRGWARALARAFLLSTLGDGPRPARQLWEMGQQQGLSEATLRRAKKELSIRARRGVVDGTQQSYWLLPGQQLPRSALPDNAPPDLEPWLKPLREQFPPPSPLDDV
jgi:hypothetical protein